MDLKYQRRMAASILKCGVNRVWINPNRLQDVADAITRADIRTAILSGSIAKLPAKGNSRGRIRGRLKQKEKGRRTGHGSRKGTLNTRYPAKLRWIKTIRAVREELRKYRDEGKIDKHVYRRYYMLSKGGMFKGRRNLEEHLAAAGLLKR
ncbi:MAG: 50S ribosomal protein L19e [Methanomassiliicoccales archaeon]